MEQKVVGLRGGKVVAPLSEPAENVVARCRGLLAEAESGELRGLLVASVVRSGHARTCWSHDDVPLTWHALGSALLALVHAWAMEGYKCDPS